MQKVIAINLNGNAYQMDEGAYATLVAYLESAGRELAQNPDRAEILADLEEAIAEKCRRVLGQHKSVVSTVEIEQIIKEMGPVHAGDEKSPASAGDGAADAGAGATKAQTGPGAPRRLYRVIDGSMIAGVCNGLAAYMHVDVTIIRIVVIGLTLVTRGALGLVYVVLAFVIPAAGTEEERSAARGESFSAQDLVDRAKSKYASFKTSADEHRYWRWEHQEWKRRWREQRRAWRRGGVAWATPPPPAGYGTQVAAGIMVPILSIMSVALFWFFIWAVFQLVTTRGVFDQMLPDDIPLWVGIVAIVLVYNMVAWPLHAARRGSYYALGHHYGMVGALDGLMSVGFAALVIWFAYQYIPEVHEVLRTIPDIVRSIVNR